MYIRIQNGAKYKDYTLTSTYTKPYIVVKSGSYLPLTTKTRTGMQLKIKNGTTTYRPLEYSREYIQKTQTNTAGLQSITGLTGKSYSTIYTTLNSQITTNGTKITSYKTSTTLVKTAPIYSKSTYDTTYYKTTCSTFTSLRLSYDYTCYSSKDPVDTSFQREGSYTVKRLIVAHSITGLASVSETTTIPNGGNANAYMITWSNNDYFYRTISVTGPAPSIASRTYTSGSKENSNNKRAKTSSLKFFVSTNSKADFQNGFAKKSYHTSGYNIAIAGAQRYTYKVTYTSDNNASATRTYSSAPLTKTYIAGTARTTSVTTISTLTGWKSTTVYTWGNKTVNTFTVTTAYAGKSSFMTWE